MKSFGNGSARGSAWPGPSGGSTRRSATFPPQATPRSRPTASAGSSSSRTTWARPWPSTTGHHGVAAAGTRSTAFTRPCESLQTRNAERPWQPAYDLQTAVNDLFNQPNLDITADVNVVSPLFDQNLVTTGPIYRKGYWSQVTAGPKTGFGLLPSDDGIQFYNSQLLTSMTPITDFQNQSSSKTRRDAGRPSSTSSSATSIDAAQLTVYTALRTNGLALGPAYNHNIDAQICSAPAPGGGLDRAGSPA